MDAELFNKFKAKYAQDSRGDDFLVNFYKAQSRVGVKAPLERITPEALKEDFLLFCFKFLFVEENKITLEDHASDYWDVVKKLLFYADFIEETLVKLKSLKQFKTLQLSLQRKK